MAPPTKRTRAASGRDIRDRLIVTVYTVSGLAGAFEGEFEKGALFEVVARREDGSEICFRVRSRVDTPQEALYYRHGGILQFVLRPLAREG